MLILCGIVTMIAARFCTWRSASTTAARPSAPTWTGTTTASMPASSSQALKMPGVRTCATGSATMKKSLVWPVIMWVPWNGRDRRGRRAVAAAAAGRRVAMSIEV